MLKDRFRPERVVLVLALMVLSFAAGAQFRSLPDGKARMLAGTSGASHEAVSAVQEVSLRPVEAFSEVMSLLRREFVSGISAEKEPELTYAAIRGLLAGLDDPYTRFMGPEEYRSFLEESQGHFEGIGATLELAKVVSALPPEKEKKDSGALSPFRCAVCGADWVNPLSYRIVRATQKGFEAEYVKEPPSYRQYRITIVAPIPGGPAEKAGIKAGDQILKIDETSAFGIGLSEAAKRIRGPAGTTVSLLISRKGEARPMEFKIVRGNIDIPVAEHKLLEAEIGYLRINTFNENSAPKVAEGLAELRKRDIKGLLLDLRNNPGGGLEPCLEVAGMFLPEGPVVYIQSRGSEPRPRSAPKEAKGIGMPLVVLVNRGSASGSEILAGALQDRGIGKLVGERTFGKGLVQTVVKLKDGSALAITTAKYFTPKHREVNKEGIVPDKEVAQPPERATVEPLSEKDLQAKAALQMLKAEIAHRAPTQTRQSRLPAAVFAH